MDQQHEAAASFHHISQNDFANRKRKKHKEDDIVVCECKFNVVDPDSACGDRCLNVLTSTECTSGYCPCGIFCLNQKFQKCEYAKTKLIKTEGRGWGLLADEDIKAGQFIIEYCGEVISWKEARRRSHTYETQGVLDAYIICLDASDYIDATKKGSIARFINHSCEPNCETRKWTVLGEVRVGIFAKQDISVGTELGYDYNFEWFGGVKVRCLCGAANCSGFLGAKSRGFQEDTYLWEDDDDRYSVEKIPLYDSAEDEPVSKLAKTIDSSVFVNDMSVINENSSTLNVSIKLEPLDSVSTSGATKAEEMKLVSQKAMTVLSNIPSGALPKKRLKKKSKGKVKEMIRKQHVNTKHVVQLLASKEAQDEVLRNEEIKTEAATQLSLMYDEIRPAIEEHERDSQDSVATCVAEKWIEACCFKLKAEFDLYSSIIKNVVCTPRPRAISDGRDGDGERKNL
ncbi:hypothetical protein ACFE04_004602 [Oxalis oulophora]